MSADVTAADILYALDRAIGNTREEAKTCEAAGRHDEAEFADNVQSGLTAFREYLRSQDFLVELAKSKENKPT